MAKIPEPSRLDETTLSSVVGGLGPPPGMSTRPGTPGDDAMGGGDGNQMLLGLAGNDAIWGHGGNDVLLGGEGDDTLIGGAGRDVLLGGAGDDVIVWSPGEGNDTVDGGEGSNVLRLHDTGLTVDQLWSLIRLQGQDLPAPSPGATQISVANIPGSITIGGQTVEFRNVATIMLVEGKGA